MIIRPCSVTIGLCLLIAMVWAPAEVAGQGVPRTPPTVDFPRASSPSVPGSTAAEALRVGDNAALFVPVSFPEDEPEASEVDLGPAMQQRDPRRGKTYMIAGAAALVGGLLVGDDIGTILAAGGVVLGVYGVILYF